MLMETKGMRCDIMGTNEAAWKALVTPTKPRLRNLSRRSVAMSESYHAPRRIRKTCKHSPAPMGIYEICHVSSGRVYIGSAICVRCRWNEHRRELREGIHRNTYLQRTWNKYGEDYFSFTLLEECQPFALIEREQYWLDFTRCADSTVGFNHAPTAQSQLGFKHSPESIEKIRQIKSNPSEHTRELLRQANLGKKRP